MQVKAITQILTSIDPSTKYAAVETMMLESNETKNISDCRFTPFATNTTNV